MKLETFFEKFELFAGAPNAVAKMRELVLRLACSGRIADQVVIDQPATELLSEIFSVRDRFLKDGKGKSRLEGSMITAGDAMDIPSTWTRCMISEVCDLQTGATPSRQESTYFGGNIPWLVSGDINRGEIFECDGRITDSGLRNSNCKVIPQNSVLIALNGQGKTRATVALLRIEAALNQSLVAMIPYSPARLLPEYLFWNLRGRYYAIRDITGQDQRRGLNMKLVGQLSLPVLPLAEQKRIVAKVDELMALCDRLEAQQQERDTRHAALARASLARFTEVPTPANLNFLFHKSYPITPADLRKIILTLAIMGLLATHQPDDEPAHELLARIRMELARLSKTRGLKIRKAMALDDAEMPFAIPENWAWTQLSEIGFVNPRNSAEDELSASFVPMALISENYGVANKHDVRRWGEIRSGYTHFAEGDVALAKITPCFENGKSTVFRGLTGQIGAGTTELHVVRPVLVDAEYVLIFLKSAYFIESGIPKMTGTAGQKRVPTEYFADSAFPLPPLAEQRRIVARVDQLMTMVDQLDVQLSEAKAKSAALLDAAIHELLNPTAEIVDLSSYRAAIGCYTVRKMEGKRYFGRTAAMKVFYLAQAHVGLELGLKPLRDAAGPLDQWIYDFEKEGGRKAWFKVAEGTTANGNKKIEYKPGRMLAEQTAQAERLLSASQRKEFDRLLSLFADRTTEEVEIIATLFAAWNDFLIDGHAPSDDQIVTEVRENWHERKGRFTPTRLQQWLGWLRQNKLVPQGRLPHTVHQPRLSLN